MPSSLTGVKLVVGIDMTVAALSMPPVAEKTSSVKELCYTSLTLSS